MKPPKRGGRPPVDPNDPSVTVTFKLPSKAYAVLCKRATEARCSVPEQIRRVLTRRAYLET